MCFLYASRFSQNYDVKSQFNRSSILCNVNLKERKILKKNITEIFFKNLLGGKMYRKGK